MVRDCSRCGTRMALIDETTRVVEYRCPDCHSKAVVEKDRGSR